MDLKYWKQFESSGKIEDYLRFAAHSGRERKEENERKKEDGHHHMEEDSHAGTYFFDRDRTEGFSGGGIR